MSTSKPVRYLVVPTAEAADEAKSARVGDKTILWCPAEDHLGRASRTAPGLLLVTQVGRTFQDEHPDVTPLLDHGRHLVISAADKPKRRSNHCWRVEPLRPGPVVDVPVMPPARVDPSVAQLLSALSPTSYQADLTWLASLPTRHSLSASFTAAVDFAAARMVALGYTVTRTPIAVGAGHSENLIGDRPGTAPGPRGLVVITAHLDSINLAGGPGASAPGADDNGSGSAGVLELGRLIATRAWQHDVRLILFGGEEEGLHGSKQYVAALPHCRARAGPRGAQHGHDREQEHCDADRAARRRDRLVRPDRRPRGRGVELHGAQGGDLAEPVRQRPRAIHQRHVPAVLSIEGADSANGHIHSSSDTLNFLDWSLASEILRMNAAALVGWLGGVEAVRPRPAGPVVSWGPGQLDVFVAGADAALHHRAYDGAWHDFESLGGVIS